MRPPRAGAVFARTSHLCGALAQSVEHRTFNPLVDGSIPSRPNFPHWSPIQSMSLRPNLQYVLHPRGTTLNANAAGVGLKASLGF
jgi:hypothetical protein